MTICIRFVIAAAAGYLLGSLHTAYFLGRKIKGIDIRDEGSGNSGASNVTMVLGIKFGAVTAVCDIAKGAAAVLLARAIVPGMSEAAYIGCFAAVLGHMFPFYMGFKGGKGLAVLLGSIAGMGFFKGLAAGAVLIIVTLVTNYIPIGTVSVGICFFAYTLYRFGLSWESLMAFAVMALMIVKHMENFKRIKDGTEATVSSVLKKK